MTHAVTKEKLDAAIRPFIRRSISVREGEGRSLWFASRRNLLRTIVQEDIRNLARRISPRNSAEVETIYETSYGDGLQLLENILSPESRANPFLFGHDQVVYMPPVGLFTAYLTALGDVLTTLEPQSVCEIGFGSGKNLLKLAARFPTIAFSGYELTASGVRMAQSMQEMSALPPNIARFVTFNGEQSRSSISRISFMQGDAAKLPAADKSVDISITVLALEQMSAILPKALAEIRRITRRHVIMIEPLLDANNWLGRQHLRSRGYLCMSLADLSAAGLKPSTVISDLPQKLKFSAPLVVCDVE